MKVTTNITAGSILDVAQQAASNLDNQVNSFVGAAEQQAEGLSQMIENTMSGIQQGFSDLLGLV